MKFFETALPPVSGSQRTARTITRARLPLLGWSGDIDEAAQVVSWLVDNAVRYGLDPQRPALPVELRLGVTASGELIIAVRDAASSFPDFAEIVSGALAPQGPTAVPLSSLYRARREFGARIACCTDPESNTKTVQVTLSPHPRSLPQGGVG
ncbi:hypothetical protein [Streptomyces sp. NPDC059003]|uniref:hypothetical protein n=1 Tax=Streptomyces sp. NPDC059003 TaxID=3346691 RepID=UPI00367544E0